MDRSLARAPGCSPVRRCAHRVRVRRDGPEHVVPAESGISQRMRDRLASDVTVRKLYTPTALVDEEQRHLLELAAAGAQVRISPAALPHETIVIDRRSMILADPRASATAAQVNQPGPGDAPERSSRSVPGLRKRGSDSATSGPTKLLHDHAARPRTTRALGSTEVRAIARGTIVRVCPAGVTSCVR
jgi:hypothetical protein